MMEAESWGGGECGLCGGQLVRNPHPRAGEPEVLTEVGYVWVCPPCINKAMSGWSRRYHEAERKAAKYREALRTLQQWDMLALTPDGRGAAMADAPWAVALIEEALGG